MTLPPLTKKQKAFAFHYAANGNGTQAARSSGYSENGIRVTAHRMLTKPNIKAAIAAREQEIAVVERQSHSVSPVEIITGLHREATGSRSPAARVSAWRTLADIHGMLGGGETELPLGLAKFLEALGRGITEGRERGSTQARELAGPPAVEVEARLVSEDG